MLPLQYQQVYGSNPSKRSPPVVCLRLHLAVLWQQDGKYHRQQAMAFFPLISVFQQF